MWSSWSLLGPVFPPIITIYVTPNDTDTATAAAREVDEDRIPCGCRSFGDRTGAVQPADQRVVCGAFGTDHASVFQISPPNVWHGVSRATRRCRITRLGNDPDLALWSWPIALVLALALTCPDPNLIPIPIPNPYPPNPPYPP